MHLGARYIVDGRAHERRVCDFLDSIAIDVSELYILGDALDYWYEYRDVVPRGHVRFFGCLARLADAGVRIVWLTGNHDIWLFDYLRDEIGLEVVDAPMLSRKILGADFVIAHGDRVGPQKASFRFICRMFRNKVCQWFYSANHPRWNVPFARGWSRHSRRYGSGVSAGQYASLLRPVLDMSCRAILDVYPGTRYIVMGHHHLPCQRPLASAPGVTMTVLGDWLDGGSYAEFDGQRLLLRNI